MKQRLLPRTIAFCVTSSLLVGSLMAGPNDSSSSSSSSDPNSPGSSSSQSPSSSPSSSSSSSASAPSATSRMGPERASQLMSATVKDQQGNSVGQINDFVINPTSGRVQFAIISLSDQAGKLTAVPWPLIRPGSEPNSVTLNVSKQKLDSAQTFDASSWPDFSQPSTSQQIYSYFGVQPGHFGAGGNVPTGGSESGGTSGQPDQSNPGSSSSPGSQNPGSSGNPPQQ